MITGPLIRRLPERDVRGNSVQGHQRVLGQLQFGRGEIFAQVGRPQHPRELLKHACLRGRFNRGAMPPWEFERNGKVVRIEPTGPLLVSLGAATDLAVEAAIAGTGIISLFDGWLQPYFDSGALEPVLEPWWQRFPGPFLYYPGRRLVPAPLRAFIDFIKISAGAEGPARKVKPNSRGGRGTTALRREV